ncbi:glycosyltransferase family 4 protein [Noviherbaspirillum galbum]|uniref:Glycosyltransferase family 4 protein n=1 Tax=Noviherbaspirillum galbum TaxID=2709383 RepID=A0A6B3STM8_9BURK|nr:glycosyltransferase family 4 protein [Noviherbaspirillum galbum]NEX64143.1 glycosyltransferase family 4 protein [Noviherbaspirillum galbum]
MKILTFSTLYPNPEKPQHGIFVETRLKHLVASKEVTARVVAPVPWFPSRHARFGSYARFARVPREEVRSGLQVMHPRYPVLPKIGMNVAPFLLAQAVKPCIGRMIDEGFDFDLIDAHYFYPDGVAASMLGKHFNKPVVITARGSDITLLPNHAIPRRLIQRAARDAAGIITVCDALRQEMTKLGVDGSRIVPLRNGVDLQLFQPGDRQALRDGLGLRGFTLLSVGNLVPVKGHDLVIRALAMLPDATLLIAGEGPERSALEKLAESLGVAARVRFLGSVPQAGLRNYYGAADALVLASSREGWANVLLESMACGTPVIASKVFGTPEVVTAPEAGKLLPERSPEAIAAAARALRDDYPDRGQTRRYAERFSWDDTTAGQLALFGTICRQRPARSAASALAALTTEGQR